MKLCLALLCALVAAVSARPQTFGSATAGGSGLQFPNNNQQLHLFAQVTGGRLPTNGGVTSSNSLALSTGILTAGLGQQTSNINSQATSNQQSSPGFPRPGFPFHQG